MIGAAMPARLSSPVLIGRAAEMAALDEALGRAERGSPVVVLVGGEAGIGKSRLTAEAAARARTRGDLVLEGGCASLGSGEGLPFAPIAEALRGWLRSASRDLVEAIIDPTTRELGRLVPELLGDGRDAALPDVPPEWAQMRLFDAFLVLLERLGERQPVVLVAEDLHWADRSTRDLLSFVARRLRGERVAVLATYRSDELHRRHPLRPWLAEMERLPRVEHLELSRFDAAEVEALVAAIRGTGVPLALVEAIDRRSEGNPFFAEELLAAGTADSGVLPARLRDVLLGRIGSLSKPAGRLLTAASVAGGSVDDDLLQSVLDVDTLGLADALDEAIASSVLVRTGSDPAAGTYAFRHALLGEAVYDEILASERRRLHGAYAAGLAARATPDGAAGASHLAALAFHAEAAGEIALALRASIAAARASAAASAFFEAASAYERAVGLWDLVPAPDRPPGEDHVELLFETSGAFMTAQEPTRARDVAQLAVAAVDPVGEPLRSARLVERLAWATYLIGDLASGTRLLQEVAARFEGEPPSPEGAGCLASLATFTFYGGRYRTAVDIAEDAISMSRDAGADGRAVEAMGALGAALAVVGDCERGLRVLREALDEARALGDPIPIGMAYLGLASTLYDCDALEESVEVGIDGSAWARGLRIPGFSGMAVEGLVPLGRWREAEAIVAEIPPGAEGSGAHWNAVFAGIIATRAGRLPEAHALLAGARDASGLLTDTAFAGNLAGGLIELALIEGRVDDARKSVDEGLLWLAGADDVRFRARIMRLGVSVEADAAAIGRARRDGAAASAATELGLERLTRLRELLAPHAAAGSVFDEARGNLGFAEAEATRLLDRPDPAAWEAAAGPFLAPRRPYELAWCRYRQAEAMLALRVPRSEVSSVLGDAWIIAGEIGAEPLTETIRGLATIARLDLPSSSGATLGSDSPIEPQTDDEVIDPFGLTAREREVLALLADGQTNRRIADTLFISESTASVHVSNIIGKLGVANRVEAAAVAVRSGLAR